MRLQYGRGGSDMKKRLIILVLIMAICAMCFAACTHTAASYTISYETDGNGTIQGETVQTLKSGEQTTEVTAVPNEGYQFVKWSDEKTNATRTDAVEKENLVYMAHFEKCKYTVNYNTSGIGRIEGNATQTVEHGEAATTVVATPASGHKFIKWSDGSTDPTRTDTNIKQNFSVTAIFEIKILGIKTLTYTTDGNGTIEGLATQQIYEESNAIPVTAIPNEGYEFVKWSDGVTTAERQDLNVIEDIAVTAQFKLIYVRYKLDYKLGEADTDITEFKFYDNDFKTVKFPVPTREYFTFEGWYISDKQVTDINGTMVVGKELLQNESREIYAKWTANETYTYKILLVYVTEVNAIIPVRDGSRQIHVNYKMSEVERQVCQAITKQMKTYLDDMLDGLVDFEVDEYFTKDIITTEYITSGSISLSENTHYIMPYDIPEICDLLEQYQTVMTSFSFNDYDYELHNSSGLAHEKYGAIHFDTLFSDLLIKNEPIENLLDLFHWGWNRVIDTYIHEFAHTIEMQIDAYDYHSVLRYYRNMQVINTLEVSKLYFNEKAIVEGNEVGIPIWFWKGELASNISEN